MALENRKASRVWFTYKETKTGNENSPNLYAVNGAKFEGRGMMDLPEATRQFESDKNKLGSGEHGTSTTLMTIGTPFSYKSVENPYEFAYFLAYLLGKADSVSGGAIPYTHELKHLAVGNLELPTFGFQYGTGSANRKFAGAVVNDCSVTFPFRGGNGKLDATFNGWTNGHYLSSGALTQLATGSFNAGIETVTNDPIINCKSCRVWIGDALETVGFGASSVGFAAEDLGTNLVELTPLMNNLTFTINNGMSLEEKIRAGGSGIVNDWNRGVRSLTLELNLRKDDSTLNWQTLADGSKTLNKAIEIDWAGPVIYGGAVQWGFNLFFPKVHITQAPEDGETPINVAVSTEVFQDTEGNAFYAYFRNGVQYGFNAVFA